MSQSPKSVKGLAKNTQMTVANVSQHLQTLHNAKLVSFKKQGNFDFL
ncbi:helix-turn-helix domain-containing protein [Paenibacillus sp. FSL K6-3166]|nr:helix-turn-helix domain-containing protein [Paenibacillus sp. VTT E-133291]